MCNDLRPHTAPTHQLAVSKVHAIKGAGWQDKAREGVASSRSPKAEVPPLKVSPADILGGKNTSVRPPSGCAFVCTCACVNVRLCTL